MKEKNMTSLVSCFARAYHFKNNNYKIFSDRLAEKMISEEEYKNISSSMIEGIRYFNPSFTGTEEEALRYIVNTQLSPTVLGRSAFCEDALTNAFNIGCREYLIFASGYDTFGYRNKLDNLKVFEIDRKPMIEDKIRRVVRSGIDNSNVRYIQCDFSDSNWVDSFSGSDYTSNEISFSSLLGISYYLTKDEFKNMIESISNLVCDGSSIIFDYPVYDEGDVSRKISALAEKANEEMKVRYSYEEIEKLLSDNKFLIYIHLNDAEMTSQYFKAYNDLTPESKITAVKGVNYCLAVKKDLFQ